MALSSFRLKKNEPAVAALILGAAALSTMASLPVFRFGVWRDGEPNVIAVFALGAIAWFWSGYLYSREGLVKLPLTVVASLLFACWCSIASVFAPFPILSFLGSPQLGEGPALFFCWSAFTLLMWTSGQSHLVMRTSLTAGFLMIIYAAVANRLGDETEFTLFGFGDYVGVFVVLMPALLHCQSKEFGLQKRVRHAVVFVGYVLAVLLSLDSGNHGAALALVFGAAIWGAMATLFAYSKSVLKRAAIRAAMVAVVVVPLCIMVGLWALGQNIDVHQEASLPELYPRLYSLVSRALMMKLTAYAFTDGEPWTYLLGNGFGHALFYIQNYLPFSGQSFLYPNWDVFYRDFVHTHSIPYEVLLSGGIVALAMYLIVFVLWIYEAAAEDRAIVIATALSYLAVVSIWFEFASLIPLLGLVMAATLRARGDAEPRWGLCVCARWPWMTAVLVGGVLSLSAGWLYWHNRGLDKTLFLSQANSLNNPAIPDDGARGDISLQRALLNACRPLAQQGDVQSQSNATAQTAWCKGMLLRTIAEIKTHPNSSLVLAYLVLAAEFTNNSESVLPESKEIEHMLQDNWGHVAKHLMSVAPHRVDVLVTYFSYVADPKVSEKTRRQGAGILKDFASEYPKNPIVLWFNGQQNINDTSPQRILDGVTEMIAAIEDYNLERYIGLPDDILSKLHKIRAEIESAQ